MTQITSDAWCGCCCHWRIWGWRKLFCMYTHISLPPLAPTFHRLSFRTHTITAEETSLPLAGPTASPIKQISSPFRLLLIKDCSEIFGSLVHSTLQATATFGKDEHCTASIG